MTNTEIVRRINEGFESGDDDAIVSYLADDVVWDMMGGFHAVGKEAFRKAIFNAAFEPTAKITVKNILAERDMVALEGMVDCTRKADRAVITYHFFDFYRLENGKVREMRSYVIEKKQ